MGVGLTDTKLRAGDKLYASCSAEVYADVVEAFPQHITIHVHRLRDLIDWDAQGEGRDDLKDDPVYSEWRSLHFPDFEGPPGPIKLECVYIERWFDMKPNDWNGPWGHVDGCDDSWTCVGSVVLDTPGNHCFRCTKLFSVLRKTCE